ncbi:hypothetical protein [Mycobacterium servetii]|uniref:FtsK domain-containing protein n=1 Tax=Mycobacterium servetii TaxID=3237418 RepID=A0ABV4BUG8_9MYCO
MGLFGFGGTPGYEPTARERWQIQQAEIRERKRIAQQEAREADRIRQQMAKDELRAREERRKIAERAQAEADREAAAAEKAILTEPRTIWTGATRGNNKPIIVWDFRCEPPADVDVKVRRHGLGALVALRPGGGSFQRNDAALVSLQNKHGSTLPPEFLVAHRAALSDVVTKYPALTRLRDDGAMARVFDAAGLVMDDKTTEQMTGTYGVYPRTVTTRNVPTLTDVCIRAGGLELTYAHRDGDSVEKWKPKLPLLRSALKARGFNSDALTLHETDTGDILIRFNDRDPFSALANLTTGAWDNEKFRSLLGIDSNGREVWITWRDTSGVIIGGVAGSGKTASLLPVFRGMENNTELYVFDGKAQRDLHPLRHICRVYDNSGDIDAPLETMQRLEKLRTLRGDAIYKRLGAASFWHLTPQQRADLGVKPVFAVLDEAQVWLKPSTDKAKATIQNQIRECVENLIRMGRSAGIVVIITTQRPSAESIPTDIRDNAQLKIAFRMTNDIMTQMTLGSIPGNPQLNPSNIPISARGRFVMDTEGAGLVLGQAGYISPGDLEDALADAQPVPDQWAVAAALAGRAPEGAGAHPASASATRTQEPPAPAASGSPLDDAALLAALAEAQRRGLIPNPAQPAAQPEPSTGGFDL